MICTYNYSEWANVIWVYYSWAMDIINNIVCSFLASGIREWSKEWINPADMPLLVEGNVLSGMFSRADNPLDESNADRTIKWEVLILSEERSVVIGKFFRSTLGKRNLGELVAWGGTSISECRVPPPYLSLIYQSTSSALSSRSQ